MSGDEIEARLQKLEAEVLSLQERNLRVQAEKGWEVSVTRRTIVAAVTYLCAAVLLNLTGNNQYLLNAVVPTLGYLLSTLSLPRIRRLWIGKYAQNN